MQDIRLEVCRRIATNVHDRILCAFSLLVKAQRTTKQEHWRHRQVLDRKSSSLPEPHFSILARNPYTKLTQLCADSGRVVLTEYVDREQLLSLLKSSAPRNPGNVRLVEQTLSLAYWLRGLRSY